jgi:hypothetical protein
MNEKRSLTVTIVAALVIAVVCTEAVVAAPTLRSVISGWAVAVIYGVGLAIVNHQTMQGARQQVMLTLVLNLLATGLLIVVLLMTREMADYKTFAITVLVGYVCLSIHKIVTLARSTSKREQLSS